MRILLGDAEVHLPLLLVSGVPLIELMDSAGNTRRFLLDTGANAVILSPEVAAISQLTTRDTGATADDAARGKVPIPIARVGAFTLGATRFEEFDAVVIVIQSGWDGLLGWPLFDGVLLTIDYDHREFILKRGELPPPDGRDVMVPVRLGDREILAELDTAWGDGAGLALEARQADGLKWASPLVPTTLGLTPLGSYRQQLGRLDGELTIGAHRVPRPIIGVADRNSGAILGAALLQYFSSVTLDVHNMRVRLEHRSPDPIAMQSVLAPGFACDLTKDPAPVTEVLPGSEAERIGLRVGDLVLALNDQPPSDGLYGQTDDTPMTLKLSRNGKTITLRVPFTTLVP